MKRTLSLILALLLCLSLCACDVLSLLNNSKEISPGVAEIDDCIVTITDCKAQINTQTGGIIAVVWVDFTNNSDQTKSLFFTAHIKAFQNGVEIKKPSTWWPSRHGIEQRDTDDVLPGYSLSTGYAFSLEDTSAPVLIQICDGSTVISEITYKL